MAQQQCGSAPFTILSTAVSSGVDSPGGVRELRVSIVDLRGVGPGRRLLFLLLLFLVVVMVCALAWLTLWLLRPVLRLLA